MLYCFIVQHGSHWELHLIACFDNGFRYVFTIIVSSVGWSAPRTQEELEDEDWPLSSYCYVNGGAGEAKSQWPRVKDGRKLNVGGNKLGDFYVCSGRSWLLNTGAPEALCGRRNFPCHLIKIVESEYLHFGAWHAVKKRLRVYMLGFPLVVVQ